MARINGSDVKAILNVVGSAARELGGPIKGQCSSLIQEYGEKWQSPDAAAFFTSAQDSFNSTFREIIGVLNTNGQTIASNAVAAITVDGGDASGINWLDVSQTNINEAGSIHRGIGGDASDVLYDPAVVGEIPGKVKAIYSSITAQLDAVASAAAGHSTAFEGSGQEQLVGALNSLKNNVSSVLDDILAQFVNTAEGKASMLQESISTVTSNLTGN